MSSPVSTLSQQAQTFPIILLVDIISSEDGAALHLSQLPITHGGNTYLAQILSASGFEVSLDSSPIGIMAIPDVTFTIGDVSGGSQGQGNISDWDNQHYFKNSSMTVTAVFYNPTTKNAASSDSRIIFKGICNAPDQVLPDSVTISAYSRFNAEFLLVPVDRVSIFSQTNFPNDGAQDCDDGNAGGSGPANANSSGYAMFHGASQTGGGADGQGDSLVVPANGAADAYLPYFGCGYGPLRATNPLGNLLVASATATVGLCSSTTIGNSGASYPASNGLQNHIVCITSGTGAGQMRRIASNTSTQITVANAFTTTPDGTSAFSVVYGFCGKDNASCKARGMYTTDSSSRTTSRFRGISYVPIPGQGGQGSVSHSNASKVTINPDQAKFNNPIAIIYGTQTVTPQELFSVTGYFNAQYTHGVYLIGAGPCYRLQNLIVGGTIVPYTSNSTYNSHGSSRTVLASGEWTYQNGVLGNAFANSEFPSDDTHGNLCMLYARFPPEFLSNVPGAAQMQVQVTGLPLWSCDSSGSMSYNAVRTDEPAWIILDVLRRSGWKLSEINLPSFYAFSAYCDQQININVSSTQTTTGFRHALSLAITQQTPAGEVLRQMLGACHAILSYDQNGLLRIDSENRLTNTTTSAAIISTGVQWVTVADGAGITIGSVLSVDAGGSQETVSVINVRAVGTSFQVNANFTKTHALGVAVTASASYSFSLSSITQDSKAYPDLKRTSLKTRDTPNQFTTQFQDAMRAYVVDTVNLISTVEANAFGAPVIGQLEAQGVETVDAATRLCQLSLYKAHGRRDSSNKILSRGNLFATLSTSVKGIDVRAGQIVTLTYLKESWSGKLFRVTQVSPVQDAQFPFWKMQFVLREHDDGWYDDINGVISSTPGTVNPPSPPVGGPGSGGGGGGPVGPPGRRLPVV